MGRNGERADEHSIIGVEIGILCLSLNIWQSPIEGLHMMSNSSVHQKKWLPFPWQKEACKRSI